MSEKDTAKEVQNLLDSIKVKPPQHLYENAEKKKDQEKRSDTYTKDKK